MADGTLKIGNQPIKINKYELTVGDVKYPVTNGLLQLIFEKDPDRQLISQDDADTFNEIVQNTNAHKKRYKSNESIREDKTSKLRNYVKISGEGLPRYMVTSNAPID